MSLLLSPFEIKGLKLKNRVVMPPMCMHSAGGDGCVTHWHHAHYGARALSQADLIFSETLAVDQDGRNGRADLMFIGRQMLRDPFRVRSAADDLKAHIDTPAPYTRYGSVRLDTPNTTQR